MKTKTIFNFLAFAMLMAAMVLTTACSGSNDLADNKPETTEPTEPVAKKGYELPVTINVTRQGDDATRASYNEDTRKLSFSTGDQLFVEGLDNGGAGQFAGTLTWQSGGTFSGTIYTQNPYSGTADELFSAAIEDSGYTIATLLPNGYESYGFFSIEGDGCGSYLNYDYTKTFANSKAAAVAQFSYEKTLSYDNGFALHPQNAILNFTITGLTANTEVTATITDTNYTPNVVITKTVTTDGSGTATFAIGVADYSYLENFSLTVGSSNFTLPSSTTLTAGKIYNITRSTGATVDLSTINANYTASNGQTLTGTLANNVKISIAAGATVILNNVTINGTNNSSYKWAGITCLGNATIILSGTNTVKGFFDEYPGIQAAAGKTLTIKGSGSLNASSNGYGVGIGGGYNIACGNIEIQGGTVEATGGEGAAGIGGGYHANCGNITISGGTVEATGGNNAAGIGCGGNGATCGDITISGGTVTARGGNSGAGIGSGLVAGCGDITITSGVTKVTATKGGDNSIGAGFNGFCSKVSIGGVETGNITESPYTYQP